MPSPEYKPDPFFSYLFGSGEGVWGSIDKRSVQEIHLKA